MKALWCSRHKPLPAQVKELSARGIVLVIPPKTFFSNAEEIIDLAKKNNCHYIISVLPLTMISRLCELAEDNGFIVLYPVMEELGELREGVQIDWERDAILDVGNKRKIVRFQCFKRVKGVKLILEDW